MIKMYWIFSLVQEILGHEFASRGIEEIICVDSNYNCIKFIDSTQNN